MLIKQKSGASDRKIKPIVNVRHDIDVKGANSNNTAFYFKTDKNYYFVTVMKDCIHLGVEKVAVSAHNDDTFKHYLTFKPQELDKCPPMEPPGTNRVISGGKDEFKKSAISISPVTSEVVDGEGVENPVESNISSPLSSGSSHTISPSSEGHHTGVAMAMQSADSGVESEARDSQEDDGAPVPAVGLVGGD